MDLVKVEDFDKNRNYSKHPESFKNGGYHMNLIEDSKIMSIVGALMKQIGKKISQGDFNLVTLVKPVQLTHSMTMLEALSNDFRYASTYLNLAAKCKDPLEQMQNVVLSAISGIHVNQSILHSKAPIDCFIGETLQLEKSDGSKFFAECINVDQPTYLIQLRGPNDDYILYSSDQVYADIHPTFTEIIGKTPRKRILKFRDGRTYEISMPTMIIEGVLNGARVLNFMDTFTIKCEQITAKMNFSYQYQGKITKITKKFTSLWRNQTQAIPNDLVDIEINKTVMIDDEERVFPLSNGSGCWLSYIQFDDKVMWRWDDPFDLWQSQRGLLPTDSCLRSDRNYLLQDKLDLAQKARNELQEDDNHDCKLRKQKSPKKSKTT